MMGWWKPYFFWDISGVQVLLPSLVIHDIYSFLLLSSLIFGLCFIDRSLSHYCSYNSARSSNTNDSSSSNASNSGRSSIGVEVIMYSCQRFVSGLIMLIMMSFNAVLYTEVIIFLGISEYYFRIRKQRRQQEQRQLSQAVTISNNEDAVDEHHHVVGYRDDEGIIVNHQREQEMKSIMISS